MRIRDNGGGTILGAVGEEADHMVAGGVLAKAKLRSTPDEKVSFTVVYEHRDCFGKPKFVGSTDKFAEDQFR
jgi:hypothetical protein